MKHEQPQQASTDNSDTPKEHGDSTQIDAGAFSLITKKDGTEASKKVLYGAAREAARKSIMREQTGRNFIHMTEEEIKHQEQKREERINEANEKNPQKQKKVFEVVMKTFSNAGKGLRGFGKEMAKRASGFNVWEAWRDKETLEEEMGRDVVLTEKTIRLRQEILEKDLGDDGKISIDGVRKYRETLREIQKMKKEGNISQEQFARVVKSLRENKKKKDHLQTEIEKSMAPWRKEVNIKIAKSLWDTGILWSSAASVGLGASVLFPGTSLIGKAGADTAYRKAKLEKQGQDSTIFKNVIVEGALETVKTSIGLAKGNRAKARADVISYVLGACAAMMHADVRGAISHGEIHNIHFKEVPEIFKDVEKEFGQDTFDHSTLVEPLEDPATDVEDTVVVGKVVEEGLAKGEVIGDFDPSIVETSHIEHMEFSEYIVPKGGSFWNVLKEGILSHPDYGTLSSAEQSNFIMNAIEELKKPQYAELLREQGVDKCFDLQAGEVFTAEELKKLNKIIATMKIDVVTTDGVVKSLSLFERADLLPEDLRNNILEHEGKIAHGEEEIKRFCWVCPPTEETETTSATPRPRVETIKSSPDKGSVKELLDDIRNDTTTPGADTTPRTYV